MNTDSNDVDLPLVVKNRATTKLNMAEIKETDEHDREITEMTQGPKRGLSDHQEDKSMNFTVQNDGGLDFQASTSSLEDAGSDNYNQLNQVSYTLIEEALDEIKEFISIMYGSCNRFYNTLLVYSELEEMREDLIERITTMIFRKPHLTNLVMHLCKIAS